MGKWSILLLLNAWILQAAILALSIYTLVTALMLGIRNPVNRLRWICLLVHLIPCAVLLCAEIVLWIISRLILSVYIYSQLYKLFVWSIFYYWIRDLALKAKRNCKSRFHDYIILVTLSDLPENEKARLLNPLVASEILGPCYPNRVHVTIIWLALILFAIVPFLPAYWKAFKGWVWKDLHKEWASNLPIESTDPQSIASMTSVDSTSTVGNMRRRQNNRSSQDPEGIRQV